MNLIIVFWYRGKDFEINNLTYPPNVGDEVILDNKFYKVTSRTFYNDGNNNPHCDLKVKKAN